MTQPAILQPRPPAAVPQGPPRRGFGYWLGRILRFYVKLLSFLGLLAVVFVLGTACMRFQRPKKVFLFMCDAFNGGIAYFDKIKPPRGEPDEGMILGDDQARDEADKDFAGFTVFTQAPTDDEEKKGKPLTTAILLNMKGNEVHRWSRPFSRMWRDWPPFEGAISDDRVYFCGARVFPDGSLLAVMQANGDTPYGYGLVKLDWDSNVVWSFAGRVHHEVDIGPDGRIYALTQESIKEPSKLPKELAFIPTPCLIDYLVVLSPDGALQDKVPILDAFLDSDYRAILDELHNQPPETDQFGKKLPPNPYGVSRRADVTHCNNVQVLTPELARAFPMFKAGQVLVSSRELSTIFVLDLEYRKVVWAAQGTWRGQHSPQFCDNGHILLMDNHGVQEGSRVLEFDPRTLAIPWRFPKKVSAEFRTNLRGSVQRLPNGNTFIVQSVTGELREVTRDGEIVWYVHIPRGHVASARRYGVDELTIAKEKGIPVR